MLRGLGFLHRVVCCCVMGSAVTILQSAAHLLPRFDAADDNLHLTYWWLRQITVLSHQYCHHSSHRVIVCIMGLLLPLYAHYPLSYSLCKRNIGYNMGAYVIMLWLGNYDYRLSFLHRIKLRHLVLLHVMVVLVRLFCYNSLLNYDKWHLYYCYYARRGCLYAYCNKRCLIGPSIPHPVWCHSPRHLPDACVSTIIKPLLSWHVVSSISNYYLKHRQKHVCILVDNRSHDYVLLLEHYGAHITNNLLSLTNNKYGRRADNKTVFVIERWTKKRINLYIRSLISVSSDVLGAVGGYAYGGRSATSDSKRGLSIIPYLGSLVAASVLRRMHQLVCQFDGQRDLRLNTYKFGDLYKLKCNVDFIMRFVMRGGQYNLVNAVGGGLVGISHLTLYHKLLKSGIIIRPPKLRQFYKHVRSIRRRWVRVISLAANSGRFFTGSRG